MELTTTIQIRRFAAGLRDEVADRFASEGRINVNGHHIFGYGLLPDGQTIQLALPPCPDLASPMKLFNALVAAHHKRKRFVAAVIVFEAWAKVAQHEPSSPAAEAVVCSLLFAAPEIADRLWVAPILDSPRRLAPWQQLEGATGAGVGQLKTSSLN
jgi:hypothetical protein